MATNEIISDLRNRTIEEIKYKYTKLREIFENDNDEIMIERVIELSSEIKSWEDSLLGIEWVVRDIAHEKRVKSFS
jgi:hypothetical protein